MSVFDDISWGAGDVCELTIKKIERQGLSLHLLPQWYDVDAIDDLKMMIGKISESSPPELAVLNQLMNSRAIRRMLGRV